MNKPNNEQPMTTADAIAYVRNYQLWRRGDDRTFDEAGLNPTTLGKAIDAVLDAAERAESAEADKHRLLGQIATMHDEHEAAEARAKELGQKYDEWARLYADQGARLRAVTDAADAMRELLIEALNFADYPVAHGLSTISSYDAVRGPSAELMRSIESCRAAIHVAGAGAQAGKEAQP